MQSHSSMDRWTPRALLLLLALGASACERGAGQSSPAARAGVADSSGAARDSSTAAAGSVPTRVPTRVPPVPTPAVVRGLYVNRWAALGQKMWQLIDVAKTTEVNALSLDVKDDRGFVLYRSRVKLAQQIGADTNMPMRPERLRAVLD
ncbi:MAG TPA: putative glycoside hydrolase, partial [Gemmatimonadaceae bacterium]|nr:putative glycoside hydrolase [Gemmatimonadaceae bacterium]